MATRARASDEPRVPLSRERVLAAAITLADEAGIGSLSMRKLAQALVVEAMTLYYYVANKEEILSGMVDLVVNEIELPALDMDWKTAIRSSAVSAHDVLVSHPWAASLILSGSGISMPRMRQMDAILGCLRGAGFSAEMTDHAYHALDSHIMGFTLWQVGMDIGSDEELAAMARVALEQISGEKLPHLVEHIEQHLKPRVAQDEGEFAFGLDLILDGLERMRTAS
jgi:AcrR family transcriptional regulator